MSRRWQQYSVPDWPLIRRFAVPVWMIDEATAARERGDWRAACAAANVEVTFGGADGPVAESLAGFAPDLLRWHLPRAPGVTTVTRGARYLLTPDGPIRPDTMVLVVHTLGLTPSDRLTLTVARAGDLAEGPIHPVPPCLWDARRAGDLRLAANGSATRLPRLTAAGERLPEALFGMGDDPPALAERISRASGPAEAWAMAGWTPVHPGDLGGYPIPGGVDPLRLAAEVRRLAFQFRRRVWAIGAADAVPSIHLVTDGGRPQVTRFSADAELAGPYRASFRLHPHFVSAPVDLRLVHDGEIDHGDLHPLVRAALFPGLPGRPERVGAGPGDRSVSLAGVGSGERSVSVVGAGPGERSIFAAGAGPGERSVSAVAAGLLAERQVRVRCRGVWHMVHYRAGRLDMPEHSAEEQRREQSLGAFGGRVGGCFQAHSAWTGGGGHLPKFLRHHRTDMFHRIRHSGARFLHLLLDDGLDPFVRDGQGRTLLHMTGEFGDAGLLNRLLTAGVDVNARDKQGITPLYEAVFPLSRRWPSDLIMALADAGADPVMPAGDMSVLGYLRSQEPHSGPDVSELITYLRGKTT